MSAGTDSEMTRILPGQLAARMPRQVPEGPSLNSYRKCAFLNPLEGQKIFVSTADAYGFAKLQKSFGIPETTSGMVELFGQYCGPDHWCFWEHDPETQVWTRREIGFRIPEFAGISDADWEPYRSAYGELRELPAPPLPNDRSAIARGKPFLYSGYKFQWLFVPELGRWELLSLGRYDATISRY